MNLKSPKLTKNSKGRKESVSSTFAFALKTSHSSAALAFLFTFITKFQLRIPPITFNAVRMMVERLETEVTNVRDGLIIDFKYKTHLNGEMNSKRKRRRFHSPRPLRGLPFNLCLRSQSVSNQAAISFAASPPRSGTWPAFLMVANDYRFSRWYQEGFMTFCVFFASNEIKFEEEE